MNPSVSVVITCYRRRKYLRQAVESVLGQTGLAPGALETIVVKDWSDPEFDAWLDSKGVRQVTEEIPTVGSMLATGVETARGDVVKFLDDDDYLVDAGHLSRIAGVMRGEWPTAILLAAGRVAVNEAGESIEATWRTGHVQPTRYGVFWEECRYPTAGTLMRERTYMNLSAVAVARKPLMARIDSLREVEAATDIAVGVLMLDALQAGVVHIVDPRPAVAIRIHESTSHAAGAINRTDIERAHRTLRRLAGSLDLSGRAADYLRLNLLAYSVQGFALRVLPPPSMGDWLRFGWSAVTRREPYVVRDFARLAPRMLR